MRQQLNDPNTLVAEVRNHVAFRERLLSEIPDLDEPTLADTLEGLTNVRELIAALLRSALDDQAIASGLSVRVSEMKARIERIENRAKLKRQLVLKAMLEADLTKLMEPDFSASIRPGSQGLDVYAEDKIPAAYWKPQPPKLDKLGIIAALKAGAEIDGAALTSPPMQLNVRTK